MKSSAGQTDTDRESSFVHDLEQGQRNLLPEDIIRNDRPIDDVLWHGPRSGSKIQRAGGLVIGGTLFLASLALASTIFEKGARLTLIIPIVLGAGGFRVLYKSLVGRKDSPRHVADEDEDSLT